MKLKIEMGLEEARVISEALQLHARELQAELVHTTDRDYRRALRERVERLESISRNLALQIASLESQPSA